jgi:hypothetical protein
MRRVAILYLNLLYLFINLFIRLSSLPALFYYAQHGYTDQEEVDIQVLKRNFGK